MKHRAAVTFVVAAVLGATIWLLSPWVTGHSEPWDADGIFYLGALVITGLIAGIVSPKPLWAQYIGSFIGQLSYELLFLKVGPLVLVGVGFLLAYCLLFVAAAFAAARIREFLAGEQTVA
jgi:hypothetical protein